MRWIVLDELVAEVVGAPGERADDACGCVRARRRPGRVRRTRSRSRASCRWRDACSRTGPSRASLFRGGRGEAGGSDHTRTLAHGIGCQSPRMTAPRPPDQAQDRALGAPVERRSFLPHHATPAYPTRLTTPHASLLSSLIACGSRVPVLRMTRWLRGERFGLACAAQRLPRGVGGRAANGRQTRAIAVQTEARHERPQLVGRRRKLLGLGGHLFHLGAHLLRRG